MRRNLSGLILFVVVLAVAAFAVIAVFSKGRLRNAPEREAEVSADPHEGMVYIWDGFDFVWMTPDEFLEMHARNPEKFVEHPKDYGWIQSIQITQK